MLAKKNSKKFLKKREFVIKFNNKFIKQSNNLSNKALKIIRNKIKLILKNPFRNKKLHSDNFLLFRIRFKDRNKEKRLIYLVKENTIYILCILDRDNNYKDLELYLKKFTE